ncbi:MAG TPA: SRPBCC family protein, partial [bacterium]|nr:SRPBCC family protein [bacterium]
ADPVSMLISAKNNDYQLDGSFNVDAEPSVIWDVLTAYEQIPHFVGSLKKSHVEEDLGVYHFLLDQEFEGGFLFFTKRIDVLLDIHETWQQRIDFADTVHKDFKLYQGCWELNPAGKEEKITYTLEAQPNFDAPFLGDFMNGGAKDLLESVRKEILRRQAAKVQREKTQDLVAQKSNEQAPSLPPQP